MSILCVDQGLASGWAIIEPFGRLPFEFGLAKAAAERNRSLQYAVHAAGAPRLVWLVLEDHSKIPLSRGTRHDWKTRARGAEGTRSTASILGQGASAGRWKEQAELLGIPKSHVRTVTPAVWKRAIFGSRAPSAPTEAFRRESVIWASALVGEPVSHDVAAAIAMAVHQATDLPLSLGLEPGKATR